MAQPIPDVITQVLDLPVARDVLNTVRLATTPVCLVPGVMGSRLKFTVGSDHEEWDPDSKVKMVFWALKGTRRKLEIFRDGMAVVNDDPRPEGFPGVSNEFYGPLLRALNNPAAGFDWPVAAIGYDWRASNVESGDHVANEIAKICRIQQTDKVIIVTHSMGGLVVRSALKTRPDFAARVLGVVHVVQPAIGAAKAYLNFITGAQEPDGAEGWVVEHIVGPQPWKAMALFSALPGPMQLLPSNAYRLPSGATFSPMDSLGNLVFDLDSWIIHYETPPGESAPRRVPLPSADIFQIYRKEGFPGVLTPFSLEILDFNKAEWAHISKKVGKNLTTAATFHESVAGLAHRNTAVVSSDQFAETIVGVVGHRYGFTPQFVVGRICGPGDKTVPFGSQTALPGSGDVARAGIGTLNTSGEHAGIFKNPAVVDFVRQNVLFLAMKAAIEAK